MPVPPLDVLTLRILDQVCPASSATSNAQGCPLAQVITFTSSTLAPQLEFGRGSLKHSAAALGIPMQLHYLPLRALGLRRAVAACALANLSAVCPETIAMVMDAYDTFVRCSPDEIVRRMDEHRAAGREVLLSVERGFSFQDKNLKPYWEARAKAGNATSHPYGNVGGVIGRASTLQHFWRDAAAEGPSLVTLVTSKNWEKYIPTADADQRPVMDLMWRAGTDAEKGNPNAHYGGAALDYDRRLFAVLVGLDLTHVRPANDHGEYGHLPLSLVNGILHRDPCVVHVPGPNHRGTVVAILNRTGPPPLRGAHVRGSAFGTSPTLPLSTWSFCQLCRSDLAHGGSAWLTRWCSNTTELNALAARAAASCKGVTELPP